MHKISKEKISDLSKANKELFLICKFGNRSDIAKKKLVEEGCDNLVCIEGGVDACINEGLDLKRGNSGISIERQVRILAEFLVFIGTVLGFYVNQFFYILPAFVGFGLFFAGITNTCGMGLLLAKAPWNN